MPPLVIERLNVSLELRVGTHKTRPRLLIELFDEHGKRRSQVWMSDDAPARIQEVVIGFSKSGVQESDMPPSFKAELLSARAEGAAAAAVTSTGIEGTSAGLFMPVDVMMAEVDNVTLNRKRQAHDRLQPTGSLRDRALGERHAQLPHEAEPLCRKPGCVTARAQRDTACAERDKKMAELQQLRTQLLNLATQTSGGDSGLGISARVFQAALLEILDEEEEGADDEDDEEEAAHDEAQGDEVVGHELHAAGSSAGAHDEPPLPRLSLPTRPVAGSAGELSMVSGALVHVVDGARLAHHALGLISSAACQVEQPNPFTCLARVRVSLRSSVELSYESTWAQPAPIRLRLLP